MRLALGIEYDGTDWQGWQTQLSRQTVQDVLESAIAEFTQQKHQTICAGRTDAGVHALGQVVHLDTVIDRPAWNWVRGLNALLPETIAVKWAQPVSDTFHARFSARSRTYVYRIFSHPVRAPFYSRQAVWVFQPLDLQAMQAAARVLMGTHDFSAFRSSECQAQSPVRTLSAVGITTSARAQPMGPDAQMIECRFQANAFLHHMVRNMVGSLLEVGKGQRSVQWLSDVLASRDRTKAAKTAPAHGLCLEWVEYDGGLLCVPESKSVV